MINTIKNKIPKHIGIIMDGNGRWAKKNGFKRNVGHENGVEPIRACLSCAKELGVEVLSLYAFSTENWKRPQLEIKLLMRLLSKNLILELPKFQKNNVKVIAMGDLQKLPQKPRELLENTIEQTKNNDGILLNLGLNYGGRQEIIRGIQKMIHHLNSEKLSAAAIPEMDSINEEMLAQNLDTHNLPDLDLLIRTSGEHRISNFMLWQLAYTELYFTDVLWPDFSRDHFLKAIEDFQNRKRRFGAGTH